jgi:hypothetical protein
MENKIKIPLPENKMRTADVLYNTYKAFDKDLPTFN